MKKRSATNATGRVARVKAWAHDLAALPPGSRFLTLHERHAHGPRGFWPRVGGVAIGAALIGVGLFQLVVPGPGILFIIVGAALLAREFRRMAVLMDAGEVRLRRGGHAAARAWRAASVAGKTLAVGVAAAGVGAAAWLAVVLTRTLF